MLTDQSAQSSELVKLVVRLCILLIDILAVGYFQDENSYLLVLYRVDNAIITDPNAVVVVIVTAGHVKAFQLLAPVWFWLLCQIVYLLKDSILHLSWNAFYLFGGGLGDNNVIRHDLPRFRSSHS